MRTDTTFEPELLDLTTFCTRTGTSRAQVYRELSEGRLTAVKRGTRTFIPSAEATRWVASLEPYVPNSSTRRA